LSGRNPKILLNPGSRTLGWVDAHPGFAGDGWKETRVDVDAGGAPGSKGSIVDMRAMVADGAADAVWSSHMIQRLHAHEVIPAFREMHRALASDGFALVTCPDLARIAALAATGEVEKIVYNSPAGPIRVIDMLFGHGRSIGEGRIGMAHHTGFTESRLARIAIQAGFAEVRCIAGGAWDLWAALLMRDCKIEDLAPMFASTNLAELFGPGEDAPPTPQ
jgi:SAM-dependent methyltransferase